jgi:hypothetical protein
LLEIEPWITEGLKDDVISRSPKIDATHLIPQTQFLLAQPHAPAQALRDAESLVVELTSELEADSAEARVTSCVDLHARRQLADDRAKVSRFETAVGR